MSKKPTSAWERRNLYAKQLSEKKVSTRNKSIFEAENVSSAAVIGNRSTVQIPQFSMGNKQKPKSTEMMQTTNKTQNSKKITVDTKLFTFKAKPLALPSKKATIIKRAQIAPSVKPNKRKSITKKSPGQPILKSNSKYVVPSRIDTGLRKKITQKRKITPREHAETVSVLSPVDLNKSKPGPSKLNDYLRKPKETPAVAAISLSKRCKISFGKASPSRRSTPFVNRVKKPKIVIMSEKKLENDKQKIMSFGKEVQNYEKWVKEQRDDIKDKEIEEVFKDEQLIATPVNTQMLKKRLKSVSFKVPDSIRKTPLALPRTPCIKSSLRKNLENFAETKGLNTAYIRHLHCLGKELSEVKRKKAIKRASTPNLRSVPNLGTPRASSPIQTTNQDLKKALRELKQVIDSGLDLQQAADWLNDIEDFYTQFEKQAVYWELKSLLLEKNDDFEAALKILNQATDKVDEEESEALQAAIINLAARIPSETSTEVSLDYKENVGSLRKRRTSAKTQDSTPNIDTSRIKFLNVKNSSTTKRFKSLATPREISFILTPVRRSMRLASACTSSIDLEELEPEQLTQAIFLPNSFL